MAGNSGRFLVSGDEVVVLADSRYRLQAVAQAPEARIEATTYDLARDLAGAREERRRQASRGGERLRQPPAVG